MCLIHVGQMSQADNWLTICNTALLFIFSLSLKWILFKENKYLCITSYLDKMRKHILHCTVIIFNSLYGNVNAICVRNNKQTLLCMCTFSDYSRIIDHCYLLLQLLLSTRNMRFGLKKNGNEFCVFIEKQFSSRDSLFSLITSLYF